MKKLLAAATLSVAIAIAATLSNGLSSNAAASGETVSLWANSTVPANSSSTDTNAVELGVKIKPSESGYITGIKFYKGAGNDGTHIGSLWSAEGKLLASVQFSSETATGWQTASFQKPVAVSANAQYTASYFAPQGHYAYSYNYFKSALTQGSLTAPASAEVNGNGVFNYTPKSTFPTGSHMASNYWVDVTFMPDAKTPPVTNPGTDNTKVTHGSQITLNNTGYKAWRGSSNQTCTEATMTVYEQEVNASQLGSSATCVWLKKGITIDADITLTACRVDAAVSTFPQYKHLNISYCTINPTKPDDWSLGAGNFNATRNQILGSSDGVRFAGTTTDTLVENYIRTKKQSTDDHHDGVQAYGAEAGGVILRNNIDADPVDGGSGNAAIFVADGAGGTFEIRDNYLAGGGDSLRLHESAYYRVTGNTIEKGSYLYHPLNTTNSIRGAFLEFSNNKLSDNATINL